MPRRHGAPRRWLGRLGAVVLVAGAVAAAPAMAASAPAWQAAGSLESELLRAQTEATFSGPEKALARVARGSRAIRGELRQGLRQTKLLDDVERALARARAAAQAKDIPALAAARADVRALVRRASFDLSLMAVQRGDVAATRSWLLIRDFRTATRFTRPVADATKALRQFEAGDINKAAAVQAVRKDLLDAYQSRTRELLAAGDAAGARGLRTSFAETSAQAAGYWAILAPRLAEDQGAKVAATMNADFAVLRQASLTGDRETYVAALGRVTTVLGSFNAAPLTDDDAKSKTGQLIRFLDLVPIEYGRGVKGDRVTLQFEIQEADAFAKAGRSLLADLRPRLDRVDPQIAATVQDRLDRMAALVSDALGKTTGVEESGTIDRLGAEATAALTAKLPQEWTTPSSESDYELIGLSLDRMEAAVSAGDFRTAEQARIEAYAFFEFGPERRLQAFAPNVVIDVEKLIWFGSSDTPGLARLIGDRASRRDVRPTRRELDAQLEIAAATLGDATSKTTVVTNAAIIVFREGLEAVLILAAITASLIGAARASRRPIMIGAALGLVASVITWLLAQTLISSLAQYGEKLEAIVGLIAIAVLLVITNWFLHKVYWSEWIGRFHRQRKRLMALDRRGFFSAQVLGLMLLGLTSVYREGFETVLFLQSLQLEAGTGVVLLGTLFGLTLTGAVAVVTFGLQKRLPYKRMLIVTGVLIGFVLIVMVGQTARTMQGSRWLSISPIDLDIPFWVGQWFGVYPTWEGAVAQLGAAAFVIGSYVLAQEIRVKRPSRRARRSAARSALRDSA